MTMNTTTATASTATTDNTVPARVTFAEACMGYVASALSTLPDTDGGLCCTTQSRLSFP
jgi:hypothetical protein